MGLLVECAWSSVRQDGYLKSLYHRHVMKWDGYRSQAAKKKAIVVVAHALVVIIWHILATGQPHHELGADYFTRRLDPNGKPAASSPSLRPSATPSPSSQPPDHPPRRTRLRRRSAGCCRTPGWGHSRIRCLSSPPAAPALNAIPVAAMRRELASPARRERALRRDMTATPDPPTPPCGSSTRPSLTRSGRGRAPRFRNWP